VGGFADRKYIYIANRLQLLQEMEEKLKAKNIGFVRIWSNVETLANIIFRDYLWEELQNLLNSKTVSEVIQTHNRNNTSQQLDLNSIVKTLTHLKGIDHNRLVYSDDDTVIRLVGNVFGFFQLLLKTSKEMDARIHQSFQQSPVIQTLFPYIKFKSDNDVAILLISVQKIFLGFFDGSETLNLTKLHGKNGNFVIFLDEYDFLEYELTQQICRASHIEEPFRFVEEFYREMRRHRLARKDYTYFVGSAQPERSKQHRATLIRRFTLLNDSDDFNIELFLGTMSVQFIRRNEFTVVPYFFNLIDIFVENKLAWEEKTQ
jgi:hypothetical protein